MRILFATSNPHKVAEVRAILGEIGVEVVSLADLHQSYPEPIEDGETFIANARIKARQYAAATGRRCLAEDSGLEVDALGGRPGVHSARYSGSEGDRATRDRANNEKLLAEMADVADGERAARFVCAMCVADPDGTVVVESRGTYEGEIARVPRGDNGFGYDPLLWLPDVGKTSAELSPEDKNARSHRGAATRELARRLVAVDAGGRER
ncbi:MAG TPA: RdgB/HAM1 family non-canonical purine NTP pyrophosphatase [Polyangiaceae bacterium]|nr:RdgB/HAM1 family non-canonical purine NTP pyrophosphatase [Polyangiaceae bacterium]